MSPWCHWWKLIKWMLTSVTIKCNLKFINRSILWTTIFRSGINILAVWLSPINSNWSHIQSFPWPTAKTTKRNVLPMCQDKFGHVGWNHLRSLCMKSKRFKELIRLLGCMVRELKMPRKGADVMHSIFSCGRIFEAFIHRSRFYSLILESAHD